MRAVARLGYRGGLGRRAMVVGPSPWGTQIWPPPRQSASEHGSGVRDATHRPGGYGPGVLRVYHREYAGRPIRALWTLEEIGAPYELTLMNWEEGSGEEHRARHPLGRVPVLEDDEGYVFESTAICLHLADLHPQAELLRLPLPSDLLSLLSTACSPSGCGWSCRFAGRAQRASRVCAAPRGWSG